MIFLLKLLRKILGLLLKLLLLPVRLLLRLAGRAFDSGSSDDGSEPSTTSASDETTEASGPPDTSAAAGEAADRSEESTTEPERAPPGARRNYERFRKALYAYAGLGLLFYIVLSVGFGLPGATVVPALAVSVAIPAGLGYWARGRTRFAWGAGMAYAGLFGLLSLVGTFGIVGTLGPSAPRAAENVTNGGVLMILGAFSLLQVGSLVAALYFGATGRAVALGTSEPTTTPSPDTAAAAAASEESPEPAGQAAEQSEPPVSEERFQGSPPAPDRTAPAGPGDTSADLAPSGSTADATGSATRSSDAAGDTAAAAASEEPPVSDAASAPDDESPPAAEQLAAEAISADDPAVVRELGDHVDDERVPDAVLRALETCAEADDPDVRVAVCDACEAIDAEATEGIVRRLRIDTNDRVATAAMEAH